MSSTQTIQRKIRYLQREMVKHAMDPARSPSKARRLVEDLARCRQQLTAGVSIG